MKLTESEKELQDEIEAESRQPYNPVENKIDLRRRRVTDLKENTRVYLPKPLPINEEAKIQIRRERLEKVYRDFVNENCTDKGEQRSNLTSAQKRGIASLKKRIKDGELIVMVTDKSGKLAVVSMEMYLEMGKVHTKNDKRVSEEKAEEIQRRTNGHVSMWLKMLGVGQ